MAKDKATTKKVTKTVTQTVTKFVCPYDGQEVELWLPCKSTLRRCIRKRQQPTW